MLHFGDITKLHGADLPPVDVITGGSPCQDMSIAGRREGFNGKRSVLFLEQIRIIKEMRENDTRNGISATELRRPQYMVWENVPGAFSSNQGEDFKTVLEETIKVAEPQIPPLSVPEKGWPGAGCLYDELGGWSVAWRVHDARHWGVPQRRRRIALVADFTGLSAPEILFERKGLCRYSQKGEKEEPATARRGGRCSESGYSGTVINDQGGQCINVSLDVTGTLRAQDHGHPPIVIQHLYDHHGQDSRGSGPLDVAHTISASYGTGGMNTPIVVNAYSLQGSMIGRKDKNGPQGSGVNEEECFTLNTIDRHAVVYGTSKNYFTTTKNVTPELTATDYKEPIFVTVTDDLHYTVRRITPLECERLQGLPDNWTDIGEWVDSKGKKRKSADSMRYKALGNAIALPFWKVIARRIAAQYDRDITMGSLFDGIGCFPLAFSHVGAVPVWASEIEEFPIAVTKYHFGED